MKTILLKLIPVLLVLLLSCDDTVKDMVNGIEAPYVIGDRGPGGGIVFYITDGGEHGLEVSPVDLNGGAAIVWISGGSTTTTLVPGGTSDSIGAGLENTNNIIAQAVAAGNNDMSTYAAGIASSYQGGGKMDWFLPSRDELQAIYDNDVGSFVDIHYWSSSEYNANAVSSINLYSGSGGNTTKNSLRPFRAIRAF